MSALRKPMNLLVADDDVVSRRLLEISLSHSGYRVSVAKDGLEALRVLEGQDSPRLAILDWMMPKVDGLEICRALRKRAPEPYIYILLLTAKDQREEMIEGLEAGADDYIAKPFNILELKARLRSGMRILELQEQLVSAREQLREHATRDSLTGLWNRRAILEILDKELIRSIREGAPVSIILADIDHFKRINDTQGHLAGDAVLREVARRMEASVRAYDSVGRYGGEELLIVSPSCGISEAVEQAERLRMCVSQEVFAVPGDVVGVTMSLGVAFATAEVRKSGELLRLADEALYTAKNAGRNRVGTGSRVYS